MSELPTNSKDASNADASNADASNADASNADAYNADELGQYQAVSSSAVLTLLLGLCSPIAFLSPVMILIPMVAVAMAVVALSKTSIAGSGLTGNRLACVGLALAIVCGVGSCTRIVVINQLVNRQIEEQTATTINVAGEN